MPSPFPGMDPYLENPARWQGFHNALISTMASMLNKLLMPRYAVLGQDRVYVSDPEDPGRRAIVPDLFFVQGEHSSAARITVGEETLLAVALPIEVELIETEIHDSYLDIIDVDEQQVVTTIEILSPTNKLRGSRGRDEYLRKRREVLASSTHWVEIDLLRQGERSAPPELAYAGDYIVHVSRADRRPRYQLWPIRLPQRLPSIRIPLLKKEEQPFDLQHLLDAVYEDTPYRILIDYHHDPIPPLPTQYVTWADELLKAKGLRS